MVRTTQALHHISAFGPGTVRFAVPKGRNAPKKGWHNNCSLLVCR